MSMADYIPTRSITQVKSHHQKLIKRYGKVENIVKKLQCKLDLPNKKVIEDPSPQDTDLSKAFILKSELQEFSSGERMPSFTSHINYSDENIFDILFTCPPKSISETLDCWS